MNTLVSKITPRSAFLAGCLLCSPALLADDSNDGSAAALVGASGDFLKPPGTIIPAGSPLKNFYFGFGPGVYDTDYSDSVNDGSVSMIGGNNTGAAYNFFFGYNFNDHVSAEAGFSTSDDLDFNATSTGGPSWEAGPVSSEYDAEFIYLAALVRYPIAPRWWAYGKVGITWWETTESYVETSGSGSTTESGSDILVALGLEFDHGLEDRIIYRFEVGYQPIGGDQDVDVISAAVGMRYEFP